MDFSQEMIHYARSRRGLDVIQAEAPALTLADTTYETVLYATGVIDFNSNEHAIRKMHAEERRVLKPGGRIFVAFYRMSSALEHFLQQCGMLNHHVLQHRECIETYLLTPAQMIRWIGERAHIGWLRAAALLLRLAVSGTLREKATSLKMQRIIRGMQNPAAFMQAAPETQPYRNEAEIRGLFDRLSISFRELRTLAACWIAKI